MTPFDEDRFIAKIAKLIDTKLDPVIARVRKLEGVDKEHERGIKDTRRELVQSNHEIQNSTTDVLLAASRHTAKAVEHLTTEVQAVKNAQATSIAPAVHGAERAAHRTEGKADAIQVAADRADTQSLAATKWSKRGPIITLVVQAIAVGVWHAVQAIIHAAQ